MSMLTMILLELVVALLLLGRATNTAAFAPVRSVVARPIRSFALLQDEEAYSSSLSRSVQDEEIEAADAIICGGGPAGLLTAIMLAQKDYGNIKVYDRLSAPPNPDDQLVWSNVDKFYLIGLGSRGQAALKKFGLWDQVEARSVKVRGRRDWNPSSPPEGEVSLRDEKLIQTVILPRDKLVGVLHQYILQNYADQVELNYGFEVEPVDFSYGKQQQALVQVSPCGKDYESGDVFCIVEGCTHVAAPLLVAADGTVRTIANAMQVLDEKRSLLQRLLSKGFHVKRYNDDNQRIYKSIPFKLPKEWRPDLNYSARTKRFNFDALPANDKGDYSGVLLLRTNDPLAQANTDPKELRDLLNEYVPQFSKLITNATIDAVAAKPVSYLPGFRYAGPRLHQGAATILLGDCAHTVKPYFGLGANSALEDVEILADYLDKYNNSTEAAIQAFSEHRAPESKTLVRISRELDRPGWRGFVVFILPIILDSIFGKLAPRVFKPNIITMLQLHEYTFQQAARRKRLDRAVQVLVLGSLVGAVGAAGTAVVKAASRWTGRSPWTITAAATIALAAIVSLAKSKRTAVA